VGGVGSWVEMFLLWQVGLGQSVGGFGWTGSKKMGLRTTLPPCQVYRLFLPKVTVRLQTDIDRLTHRTWPTSYVVGKIKVCVLSILFCTSCNAKLILNITGTVVRAKVFVSGAYISAVRKAELRMVEQPIRTRCCVVWWNFITKQFGYDPWSVRQDICHTTQIICTKSKCIISC